jgi:hypothetical protein
MLSQLEAVPWYVIYLFCRISMGSRNKKQSVANYPTMHEFFQLYGLWREEKNNNRYFVSRAALPVFRIRNPVHFYPKDPGSGSGMIFFRIPDPYHVPNSVYLQDFIFINGEKQEKKNNFVWNMNSIMTYSCMKKVSLFFPSLMCRIWIRDTDPG